jgi:hypothetical protein
MGRPNVGVLLCRAGDLVQATYCGDLGQASSHHQLASLAFAVATMVVAGCVHVAGELSHAWSWAAQLATTATCAGTARTDLL